MESGEKRTLYLGIELASKRWVLAFSNGEKVREVTVVARDQGGVVEQISRAKEKLGVGAEGEVVSCYEAGRDGFWVHRFLEREGVKNRVVDAASIEVNRRKRHAKTDGMDAKKLVGMLMRYEHGERTVWRVAEVPSEGEEDERRLHREVERLKKERTGHRNRVRGLLALEGIVVGRVENIEVEELRTWEGKGLLEGLREELRREVARCRKVDEQIKELEKRRGERLKKPETESDEIARKLSKMRAVGAGSAWVLAKEFFGWRKFRNRREVGGLSGLTGTPYGSGDMMRDQGISKAGNKRVRWIMIELAWGWLRYQPQSELSRWFWERFGHGNARMRRIGIVALARKLLVALWKYATWGEVPAGAIVRA